MAITIPGLAIKVDIDATNVLPAITAISTGMTAAMMAVDRAAAIGSRALSQFSEAANRLDPVADLSDKLSISTKTLMAWGTAAELSGGSLDAVATTMLKYQAVLGDAIMGNGAAQKAFERLGISATELAGMSNKQGILAVADALNSMSSASRRAAGIDVFGKSFNDIDLFVREIREAEEQAERLGITLDRDVINRIRAVNDNSILIGKQVSSIGDRVKADLAPAINVVLKDTQEWLAKLKEGGGWVQAFGGLSGKGRTPQDTVNNLRVIAEAMSPYHTWKNIFTGKGALSDLIKGQGVNDNPAAKFFDRVKKEEATLNSDSSRKAVGELIGRQAARLGAIIAGLSQSATASVGSAMEMMGMGKAGTQRVAAPQFAGALEQGTAAAYAAAYQRDQKNKTDEKIEKNTEKANEFLKAAKDGILAIRDRLPRFALASP